MAIDHHYRDWFWRFQYLGCALAQSVLHCFMFIMVLDSPSARVRSSWYGSLWFSKLLLQLVGARDGTFIQVSAFH